MADASVNIRFTGHPGSAVAASNAVASSFGRVGAAAKRVAMLVAGIGFAALTVGLVKAGKAAIEFDRGMRNVNSIARLSEKQLDRLSKRVLDLAGPTAQAPRTLAEGLYDVVSSGFDANDAVKILAVTAKAATAGLTDTAVATKAVAAVLNAYNLEAKDAREVSDVLFETVNKGVLTFEELATSIGDVLPFASQLKVPIEDVGAAMATMTLQGLSAAESSTRLKGLLVTMIKPGEDLAKTIKEVGFASGSAMVEQLGLVETVRRLDEAANSNKETLGQWFPNIRALGGFLSLSGDQMRRFADIAGSMDEATKGAGATTRAFNEQAKSLSFQWQKAKAALTAAAIPIAQLLFPALVKGAQAVADFAGRIEGAAPRIKAAFATFKEFFTGFVGPVRGAAMALKDFASFGVEGLQRITSLFSDSGAGGAANFGRTLASSLVAAAAGFAAYKGAAIAAKVATQGFNRALRISPLGLIVGAITGVALLFEQLRGQVEQTTSTFERAANAARGYNSALQALKGGKAAVRDANLQLEAAELGVRGAIQARNQVEKEAGKDSLAYKQAQLAVRQAFAARENAERAVAAATTEVGRAQSQAARQTERFVNSLATQIAVMQDAPGFFKAGTHEINRQSASYQVLLGNLTDMARGVDQFGNKVADLSPKMRLSAGAALFLVQELGKLPTRKEIEVFLKDEGNRRRIREFMRELGLLPEEKNVKVGAPGVTEAIDGLKGVKGAADKVPKKTDAKVSAPGAKKAKGDVDDVSDATDDLDRKKAEPVIRAIDRASEAIRRILGLLAGVRSKTVSVTTIHRTIKQTSGFVERAVGGFIPGPDTGGRDSVLSYLAPGELVLNRGQQAALGGPRRLAEMFGFSTAGVPGVESFAEGGFVSGLRSRLKHSRSRDKKHSGYKAKLRAVNRLQRRLDGVRERQDRMARSIDQDDRMFSISVEEFITVDADGNEHLNPGAVAQRVSELDKLMRRKDKLIGLIDEETAVLNALLRALDAAVKAYRAEIRDQQRVIREMTALIRDATKKMQDAPDEAKGSYERIISQAEGRRDNARSRIGELRGLISTAHEDRRNFRREKRDQPLDVRDVRLDIRTLEAEKQQVLAIRPLPPQETSFGAEEAAVAAGADVSGDIGGGAGGALVDEAQQAREAKEKAFLQALVDEMKRELGQLRMALGIQRAQLPVIGAFQRGTIHVPATGLALVHAGERIRPAGVRDLDRGGGDGGSIEHVAITLAMDDRLDRLVDARIDRSSDRVSVHMGREADRRFRDGRAGQLSGFIRRQ